VLKAIENYEKNVYLSIETIEKFAKPLNG